jgi:hypothetical protein
MKIHLTIRENVISASLHDCPGSGELLRQLPLTITMYDLFCREKFGALPHALPYGRALRTQTYEAGDIVYWAPSGDLAVFHRHDGQKITGDFYVLGKVDKNAELFAEPGPVQVTIACAALH